MKIRLHKHLAKLGIASLRKSEVYIQKGYVKVNNKTITQMGVFVDPDIDTIEVSEKEILNEKTKLVYYALNKPVSYVTTTRATSIESKIITELVPKTPKIYPIGRLDKDSCGLIILTNDGDLCFKLTHPQFDHEKEYEVKVNPKITLRAIKKMESGMNIQGYKTQKTVIHRLNQNTFRITLKEGRNRQIRRMCRKIGVNVVSLKRIRIGNFHLSNLLEGKYQILSNTDIKKLTCI